MNPQIHPETSPKNAHPKTAYLALARRFRPQNFSQLLGQEALVNTLNNALSQGQVSHAYLFHGPRGTGKTSTARILAKNLNCLQASDATKACQKCSNCREISEGISLDVLEIDAASHRGIDDIRQIQENLSYQASKSRYRIYIIDEAHMLTKEACNALLKSLEAPPSHVKFFFATTELHKIPSTILSRCQCFAFKNFCIETIVSQLETILLELQLSAEPESLRSLAYFAKGSMRDAQSLLDQVLAFSKGSITLEAVRNLLGLLPRSQFFALDQATQKEDYSFAFSLTAQLFSQGCDLRRFIEELGQHFRYLFMSKLNVAIDELSPSEKASYKKHAEIYTQAQCLHLIELLDQALHTIKDSLSPRFFLEQLLLKILKSHRGTNLSELFERLCLLEEKIRAGQSQTEPMKAHRAPLSAPETKKDSSPLKKVDLLATPPQTRLQSSLDKEKIPNTIPVKNKSPDIQAPITQPPQRLEKVLAPKLPEEISPEQTVVFSAEEKREIDTLLQFASVELEGTIRRL